MRPQSQYNKKDFKGIHSLCRICFCALLVTYEYPFPPPLFFSETLTTTGVTL